MRVSFIAFLCREEISVRNQSSYLELYWSSRCWKLSMRGLKRIIAAQAHHHPKISPASFQFKYNFIPVTARMRVPSFKCGVCWTQRVADKLVNLPSLTVNTYKPQPFTWETSWYKWCQSCLTSFNLADEIRKKWLEPSSRKSLQRSRLQEKSIDSGARHDYFL